MNNSQPSILSAQVVPPGYKQTEVGVIPEDWGVHELVQVADRVSVGLASSVTKHYRERGVPIVRNLNIKDGYFDAGDMLYLDEKFAKANVSKAAKAFDVITVHTGANLGQTCVLPVQFDNCQTFTTLITTPRVNIVDSYYLACVMGSGYGRQEMTRLEVGGGKGNLNTADLKKFRVPLPPTKAEQEAIAEALSDADAVIESLEQLLTKKRQLKQGAMQELLTGKKRLPGFNGEWEVKPLGDLFNFSGGFTASRDQLSSEGYCYLHYGDIHTSRKSFVDVRSEYQDIPKLDILLKRVSSVSLLDDGDVVFVDASEDDEGTSKHVVVVNPEGIPFISGLHTIVAKCYTNALAHQYRRYCFQTSAAKIQFRFFAVGTKVSGISKTNIARVALPVPSVSEQTAIATILSDMDEEIAALEAKLAKARQLKQGMMQELLTGRIRLI